MVSPKLIKQIYVCWDFCQGLNTLHVIKDIHIQLSTAICDLLDNSEIQ